MVSDEAADDASAFEGVEVEAEQAPAAGDALAQQEALIEEQRRTISELQTPVLQVWDRILALPIVGSLDTNRAQEMTEALLERIVATGSELVILDITAVPVVDTAVAKTLCWRWRRVRGAAGPEHPRRDACRT